MNFSKRVDLIKSSDTRALLNIIGFDEMISFAGGLPAEEGFPVDELNQVMQNFMSEYGNKALQYGPTEGVLELRGLICERIKNTHGVSLSTDQVLITSGSQQALDLLGKVFIDEGDGILIEEPTYFSAINAFKAYGAKFIGVATDDEGAIEASLVEGVNQEDSIKFGYYIPDFQNPSGRLWSLERKLSVLKIHQDYDIPLIEDCPYGEIQFEGDKISSFLKLSGGENVIHLGSFSKVFCPGFRIGYIIAEPEVIKKCVLLKQSMDLHTSTFTQYILIAYLKQFNLDENIDQIKTIYRGKRDVMIDAIKTYMPKSVHFKRPKGGMFLWLNLDKTLDSRVLYQMALENKIAFVAGDAFYLNQVKSSGLRLNYTNMSNEKIVEGIKGLSQLIKQYEITRDHEGTTGLK